MVEDLGCAPRRALADGLESLTVSIVVEDVGPRVRDGP
jgi:hypothetical protein